MITTLLTAAAILLSLALPFFPEGLSPSILAYLALLGLAGVGGFLRSTAARKQLVLLIPWALALALAACVGLAHGNPSRQLLEDALPYLLFALGLPLFLFGLVWMLYILARYWVTMPIVFMEGVTGKDAVDRARALTRGGFWVLVWVLLVRWALNLLAYGDTARGNIDTDSTAGNLIVSMILGLPVEVTLAIIMALVYFKFRQARGETMSQILAGYRATSRGREDAAAG